MLHDTVLLLLLLSHSVVSDSVQSHRQQPTRLCRPSDSPGKNIGVGNHFLLQCMKVKSESEVAQSCLTLSDPMDCSPPGSSVHRIFQARVLEWVAIAFSCDDEYMDILYIEMATHPSVPAWGIPWTEEPGGPPVHGIAGSDMTERACTHTDTHTHTHTHTDLP